MSSVSQEMELYLLWLHHEVTIIIVIFFFIITIRYR